MKGPIKLWAQSTPINSSTFSSRRKVAELFKPFLLTDFHKTATGRISTFCFTARKHLHFKKRRQHILKDEHSHISLEAVSWSWFSVGSFRAKRISALFVEPLGISGRTQAFHNFRANCLLESTSLLPELFQSLLKHYWKVGDQRLRKSSLTLGRKALALSSSTCILHWSERSQWTLSAFQLWQDDKILQANISVPGSAVPSVELSRDDGNRPLKARGRELFAVRVLQSPGGFGILSLTSLKELGSVTLDTVHT